MTSNVCEGDVDCKRPRKRKFLIKCIISENYTANIVLKKVFVAEIKDKRKIPLLLAILPTMPAECAHLKRINGNLIILADIDKNVEEDCLSKIKDLFPDLKLKYVEVPSCKPKTRKQFEETKKFWPTAFHENKELEKKLQNIFFEERRIKTYGELFMRVERIKGGLIYDAMKNEIIVEPLAAVDGHPLQHTTMRLVESLADMHKAARVKHGILTRGPDSGESYLATGLDVILFHEPCTMCAMALVHSRAKRVFFATPNERIGALMSRWRIQEQPLINHHYQVFRIVEDL